MNILCKLNIHWHNIPATVWCDGDSYILGKQCKCGHKKITDWQQAADAISQAYTDGKRAQLIQMQP